MQPATSSTSDYERINQYIKEFLRFNKYQSTLECFEAEERTKLVTSKTKKMNIHPDDPKILDTFPRMYRFFDSDQHSSDREGRLERQIKVLQTRHNDLLASARQIFAVAVDSVHTMDTEVREKLAPGADHKDFDTKISDYKVILGKYHGMLL